MVPTRHSFPEVYPDGERPPKRGVVDEKLSLQTPSYGFGWVISRVELFKALKIVDEAPIRTWLIELPGIVNQKFYARWKTNGYYENNDYRPDIPDAIPIGDDFLLILLACNSSVEMMDSVMADKAYHDECRACMNYPKTMSLQPAWFRVGLRRMPEDFISRHQDGQ